MRPTKTVVCLERIPINLLSGYDLRVFNLIKALSEYWELCVLVHNSEQKHIEWFLERVPEINVISMAKGYCGRRKKSRAMSYIKSRILKYSGFDYSYHAFIREQVKKTDADVIMAFGLHSSPYLLGFGDKLTICDLIDDPLRQSKTISPKIREKIDRLKNVIWIYAMYYQVLSECRILISVTDDDTKGIIRHSRHKAVFSIPNGVDTDYYIPQEEGKEPIILFFGNMDYAPNINAVKYFMEKIWRTVHVNYPTAHFLIAGKNPDPSIQDMASTYENVNAVGFVDDMRAYIGSAWVVVAPMVDGTGIKNKILEAFAMEKPVVATPLAAQGLSVAKNDKTMYISDDPSEYAMMILELMKNENLRREVGEKALKHVVKGYTWRSQAQEIDRIITTFQQSRNS